MFMIRNVLWAAGLLLWSFHIQAQSFSEQEIAQLAQEVTRTLAGRTNSKTGVALTRCVSEGRTVIYQYRVPDNWKMPGNLKAAIIRQFKKESIGQFYHRNQINSAFTYTDSEGTLRGQVEVPWRDFSSDPVVPNKLGTYVDFEGHEKAMGVNIKLKQPLGWTYEEGVRPHIPGKFIGKGASYNLIIRDTGQFFSRNDSRALFEDQEWRNVIAEEWIENEGGELLKAEVVEIDRYPALQITYTGSRKNLETSFNYMAICWGIYFEDRLILLQGIASNTSYRTNLPVFKAITRSVVFPDQYK